MSSKSSGEAFISVDIEAAGPIPGQYSMLSLGACLVEDLDHSFYVELRPINDNAEPKALEITGFSLAALRVSGEKPEDAIVKFWNWINAAAGTRAPIFVGFNAGFDWSFVNWYFHTYVKENPFGFAPLDIKAYYMGLSGCSWSDTKSSRIPHEYQSSPHEKHNALSDAKAQAEVFSKLLAAPRR
jgi:DNA polymerase III epsilon subunit-like protein